MALFGKPKFATLRTRASQQPGKGEWFNCKGCTELINRADVGANFNICPKCDYHYPLTATERIDQLCKAGSFEELDAEMKSTDVLDFDGYEATLEDKIAKTGLNDAVVCGFGKIGKQLVGLCVMDFRFMGASMGSVVGEKITNLIEEATQRKTPVLIVTASGGARMQEGSLSLMQMAKTSGALARLDQVGLPLICLLTHPTFGGVTASFASLGDVIVAEPRALIGFAGARVIETTIKTELPEDFQTTEFLEAHGLIDRIIHRNDLSKEMQLILSYFSRAGKSEKKAKK